MLPMEFDPRMLRSLPLPDPAAIHRVQQVLGAVVLRRVVPYFIRRRRSEAVVVARASESFRIERLEDPDVRSRAVSLLTRRADRWTVSLHERVFDYLAFAVPTGPSNRLGDTSEERRALAFAELLLRHELEHMVHPERTEEQVVASDVDFLLFRRDTDPTYFQTLVDALADELNGLCGAAYLQLLERRDAGEDATELTAAILVAQAAQLSELPTDLLLQVAESSDARTEARIIEACYARSVAAGSSLFRRAEALERALTLFRSLLGREPVTAESVFDAFRDRWGAVGLLGELGIPEATVRQTKPEALFRLFSERIADLGPKSPPSTSQGPLSLPPPSPNEEPVRKTLAERVEEARRAPDIPSQVVAVIERNQVNAVGHSGAKYAELIETLLAIPWGRLEPIRVSPSELEAGLERSHYGLERPKELLCDFFTNLIWRYQAWSSDGKDAGPRPREAAEGTSKSPHRPRSALGAPGGSAFLLVGPPGVGKTSLAISLAETLGIPYHKLSLGGMRDEADLRGHGFTYEGSKPGAIVQGLIKMGVLNGMFILDEADKTEPFAIATLLEILDPEQNHLFHDKYTQSTVDVDLSSCHFFLTANTLETVPPPVLNRCEVVHLDRYGIDEKIAIAERHLIPRIRSKYAIDADTIDFEPAQRDELLRYLVQSYTFEAGVRQLERIIRTLLLRLHRKEILGAGRSTVSVTRALIKRVLELPSRPRQANPNDRVGEVLGLGVNVALGVGSLIPIQATRMREGGNRQPEALSMVHATGNIERVMDESRKVATTAILHCADELALPRAYEADPVHLHFMGGSTPKDGPSAGTAIALALASLMTRLPVRRDVAVTGEIDTQGRINAIGGLDVKLDTAASAGCKTVIIPRENLRGPGGIERFPRALQRELQVLDFASWQGEHEPFDYGRHVLQVVAVDHVVEAWQVAALQPGPVDDLVALLAAEGRALRERLPELAGTGEPEVLLLLAKTAEELEEELFALAPCERHADCWVLVPPDSERSAAERLPSLGRCARVVTFDPSSQALVPEIDAARLRSPKPVEPGNVSVIGPYFLLRQSLSAKPAVAGRWFANNFCVQGLKLKQCKSVLNRVYARLAELPPEALAHCPLLVDDDGVVLVDLAIIPEPYRLDPGRAEELVQRGLEAWLGGLGPATERPAGAQGTATASPEPSTMR